MTTEKALVVTPWHNFRQLDRFLSAWHVDDRCPLLVLQNDADEEGCAVTKNKGIEEAVMRGAETVVILDDDCFPTEATPDLSSLIKAHQLALEPQRVEMFEQVTEPASRGTPYSETTMEMPVAASIGFWTEIGDYCAVRQLAYAGKQMQFVRKAIFGRYFPLCGMNIAFKPAVWGRWCEFIDVARFDDIWMGWLWQRFAYQHRYCFNLRGPIARHSRQSNVWKNLEDEARYLKENETLWREIAESKHDDYESLIRLLPEETRT